MLAAPVFPQEIFERIIDTVGDWDHPDDRERTLRACSLVCSSFLDPAQRHLFRFVTICLPEVEHLPIPQSILWRLNPRICAFVVGLDIMYNVTEDATFPTIAPLKRLEELKLFGFGFGDEDVEWLEVPDQGRMDCYNFLRSSGIKVLTLERINDFPAAAVCLCSNLVALILRGSNLTTDADGLALPLAVDDATTSNGYIQSLESLNSTMEPLLDFLRQPSPLLSIDRLQDLELSVFDSEGYELCQLLLKLTTKTLASLSLSVHDSWVENFHLPRPGILHRVRLHPETHEEFRTIIPFLESIPEENKLERVSIEDYPHAITMCQEPYNAERFADWRRLEKVLMRERHARLHGVLIQLPEICSEVQALIFSMMLLPKLSTARRMEVLPYPKEEHTIIAFHNVQFPDLFDID